MTVLVEVERVKMVVVCQSAGTVVRHRRQIKCFIGLKANISCLEGPGCWPTTTMKDAGCDELMMVMLTSVVVELWQSQLLRCCQLYWLAQQLEWRLAVCPVS